MSAKSNGSQFDSLSRRERQIMAAIYRLGEARVADVRKEIADAPSYSALRALIRILEDKGCLAHRQVGASYVYRATLPKRQASRRALRNLVGTFFGITL